MKSDIHVAFGAPLHKEDNKEQTYGCRANNPDICRYYMLEETCAFTNETKICRHPSRSWKKQYEKLKGGSTT